MSESEKMLLDDAISTAIQSEKKYIIAGRCMVALAAADLVLAGLLLWSVFH